MRLKLRLPVPLSRARNLRHVVDNSCCDLWTILSRSRIRTPIGTPSLYIIKKCCFNWGIIDFAFGLAYIEEIFIDFASFMIFCATLIEYTLVLRIKYTEFDSFEFIWHNLVIYSLIWLNILPWIIEKCYFDRGGVDFTLLLPIYWRILINSNAFYEIIYHVDWLYVGFRIKYTGSDPFWSIRCSLVECSYWFPSQIVHIWHNLIEYTTDYHITLF